jgi:hypothetical protein
MSRRIWYALLGGAALLLIVISAIWFLRTHERVDKQVHVPGYGEPTFNPLYALRETLRRDGVEAQSRPRLALDKMALTPTDTVVLLDDPRNITPDQERQLLAWVASGGHLLLRTPPPSYQEGAGQSSEKVPVLAALGVVPAGVGGCVRWQVEGDGQHSEFCRGQAFSLNDDAKSQLRWGMQSSVVFGYARLVHGRGRVDVLADMDFMLNQGNEARPFNGATVLEKGPSGGLRDVAHRDLTRLVLVPNYGKGTIHLLYETQRPSLWWLLLKQGWMAWVPLLLALLGWLWASAQRFGPWLPSPRSGRRSLLEHVRASGDHLLRHEKAPLLYDAVRRAFLSRLQRRLPVAAALSGDARAHAIAEHLGWPLARVQLALQAPASRDHAALRDRIRLLIQMRNLL